MYHNNFFTDEQWECIRVCVENAPIPYDITKKKIPVAIHHTATSPSSPIYFTTPVFQVHNHAVHVTNVSAKM